MKTYSSIYLIVLIIIDINISLKYICSKLKVVDFLCGSNNDNFYRT